MNAIASATRPAYWAPSSDASPGSESASERIREVPPRPLLPDGLRVGNRDEAFPPGLKLGWTPAPAPVAPTNGSPPTPSLERTPAGVRTPPPGVGVPPGVRVPPAVRAPPAPPAPAGVLAAPGAVTRIGTEAFGWVCTYWPVPVTVSFTDLTDVAEAAMGTRARSCLCWEAESTVPTEHEFVPSLEQPKVNLGFWLDGEVARWRTTLLTFPPEDHTLTFHRAEWPRATLASSRRRPTHRYFRAEASARVRASGVAATGELPLSRVTASEAVAEAGGVEAAGESLAAADEPEEEGGGLGLGLGDDAAGVVEAGAVEDGVVLPFGGELLGGEPLEPPEPLGAGVVGLGLALCVAGALGLGEDGPVAASHCLAEAPLTADVWASITGARAA